MSKRSHYLQHVNYRDLHNWSVQSLSSYDHNYNDQYPLVRIGDFLKRNRTAINLEYDQEYKRVTIRINNGGVLLRDREFGKNIGTKRQYLISEGQFLLSKIDARNGAFGVVTNEIDGAIITGNFWTYDVDYNLINPHFLTLITTTDKFIEFCEMASHGTTNRRYLQEKLFLDQKIPLPTLIEQKKIVFNYQKTVNDANELKKYSFELRKSESEYVYQQLKIRFTDNKELKERILSIYNFKNLERWDVMSLKKKQTVYTSKYPTVKLGEIIEFFNRDQDNVGLSVNTSKATPHKQYNYLGMENIEKNIGEINEMQQVFGRDIKSQTLKVPRNYYIYGKLRPYLNKYWLNKQDDFQDIICSSEFFVFKIKDNINFGYFTYILSSKIIQAQINHIMSGARMPRINMTDFQNITVPIAPADIQTKISNYICSNRKKALFLEKKSEKLFSQSLINFEKEIFNI